MLHFSFRHQNQHVLLRLKSCLGQPLVQAEAGDRRLAIGWQDDRQMEANTADAPMKEAPEDEPIPPSLSANVGITMGVVVLSRQMP